jgi:chemotaxis methyl-accepting protein methylase
LKKQAKREHRKQEHADDAPKVAPSIKTGDLFPIVGIGASAGGLEALEQFLSHVPEGSGMAFVIVQHLDPTHKGVMPELLQRSTGMKVVQVKDQTKVQPGRVYVIPPNKDMSVLHGVLHLLEPVSPRGLRLPIDFFFRSLAADRGERSVGIVLSGMGSDGTLGLRAIKEKGGLVLVQEPSSAKFDAMPRSAVDSGMADFTAPSGDLPGKLIAYLTHAPLMAGVGLPPEGKTRSALEKVVILLRAHNGNDFSLYKKNTLYRRIERRMNIHQIDKIATYVRFLRENPHELELLFKELLIGVTSFFRDPASWEQLRDLAIPALLSTRPAGRRMRAWVPGCSTGEEAYSLAMVFKEALEQAKPKGIVPIQIFATDLDRDAVDKARQGLFPNNIAADVSPDRLDRFFIKEENGYRAGKMIREMVIFAPQNVIMDPPFTRLDLIICRNLLIYLAQEVQRKLMPLFHYSLNPGGMLFLGSAESIGGFSDLFAHVSSKSRIFRRIDSPLRAEPVEFPSSFAPALPALHEELETPKPGVSLQSLADQVLLRSYCPPAVLVNAKGDILYISGRTGRYLEPAAGKANWNIFAMAREGLRHELTRAFGKARLQKGAVTLTGLKVGTDGGEKVVDMTVEAMEEPLGLRGTVLVTFIEAAAAPPAKTKAGGRAPKGSGRSAQGKDLERELHQVREELQITREEMQTSQEELKSANEELQSTNEELQSTNEELTTSKEEMQSLNEELQTVNAELQAKVDELLRMNNDMKHLLNSSDVATVFLDGDLNVRRFTTPATRIIHLIPGDVGRPLTDIASSLLYPALASDVREVLETLASVEKEIATGDGRWFALRILPYRTAENRIDGVVITLTEISAAKKLEEKLRAIIDESVPANRSHGDKP